MNNELPQFKVTLGIMPNYADTKDGMLIDGVSEDRPAALAGIKAGDFLKRIGNCEVREIYSYMECLSRVHPGELLPVTVARNGEELTLNVQF